MSLAVKQTKGFTLIEAIVTLAIITILATLATPSFIDLLDKRRIGTSANTIYSALQEARSIAIAEANIVSACLSMDGFSCQSSIPKASNAQFISFRGTSSPTASTWQTIGLRATPINTKAGKISLGKFGGPKKVIQFQADGMTLGSVQNGSFKLTNGKNAIAKKVVVARTGRISIRES